MNREEIFEMIEDTQIANLIVEWHESDSKITQNEIYGFLYYQEGFTTQDLKSVGIEWR